MRTAPATDVKRRTIRIFPLLAVALWFAAGSGASADVVLTPSFSAFHGFSDNVNAVPDDAPAAMLRHESSFVLLRPGARLQLRAGQQGALGFGYAAEWEKYDAASEGDVVAHVAGVDGRLGGPKDGLKLTAHAGFTGRELLNVRSAGGQPFLHSRAWRGGGGAEFRLMKQGRLAVFANYAVANKRYPRYLAPVDPANPAALGSREESLQSVTLGVSGRPLEALTLQLSALGLDNGGNIYAQQQGAWRDFYSYRGQGATFTVAGAPLRRLVCSASGSWLGRSSKERLVAATGETEASTSLSATGSLFWSLGRGAGLSVEYTRFRHDSNAPRASFTSHRLLAGVRLSEDLKLF